jgi:hypothetical protein
MDKPLMADATVQVTLPSGVQETSSAPLTYFFTVMPQWSDNHERRGS